MKCFPAVITLSNTSLTLYLLAVALWLQRRAFISSSSLELVSLRAVHLLSYAVKVNCLGRCSHVPRNVPPVSLEYVETIAVEAESTVRVVIFNPSNLRTEVSQVISRTIIESLGTPPWIISIANIRNEKKLTGMPIDFAALEPR
jgi:hypothetical protein